VRYTVSSGGVVIGETDLGFVRSAVGIRAGWFHPNAHGERVLPRILPPLASMRAHLDRRSGDVGETAHHADAHPLVLHRADGSVVPTRTLGIQDMHQLVALAEWEEARREALAWSPEAGEEDELLASLEADGDGDDCEPLAGDPRLDDAPMEPDAGWAPDDEPADHPRYQIILELVDEGAIP
jgi:hypothetical protein